MLPDALKKLIHELAKLPGVGPRGAERIALHIITDGKNSALLLADAISAAIDEVGFCDVCGALAKKGELCGVCANPARDKTKICIVEKPLDAVAVERSGVYGGVYHVLGGVLSPIEGITPDDLKIPELMSRIKNDGVTEVIVATNPSAEGDVTASYIAEELRPLGVKATRLARGLPSGGQVDYADSDTLEMAMANRFEL